MRYWFHSDVRASLKKKPNISCRQFQSHRNVRKLSVTAVITCEWTTIIGSIPTYSGLPSTEHLTGGESASFDSQCSVCERTRTRLAASECALRYTPPPPLIIPPTKLAPKLHTTSSILKYREKNIIYILGIEFAFRRKRSLATGWIYSGTLNRWKHPHKQWMRWEAASYLYNHHILTKT